MDILTDIQEFARKAHGDQRRKFADEPYIMHPVRVMQLCKEYTLDLPVLSAALLHDVLEDTPVTKEELLDYLRSIMKPEDADRTLTLTGELTDIYVKANYPQWNRRKRKSAEAERLSKVSGNAQTVKYADIIDNTLDISNADDFKSTFLHECRKLLKVMDKGNPKLRERAMATVDSFLTE